MPPLYITEYANNGRELKKNIVQAAEEPRLADQKITLSGTSAQSAALNAKTRLVRLHTTEICSFDVGADPTATASKARLAADQTEYISISQDLHDAGDVKIAAITNT